MYTITQVLQFMYTEYYNIFFVVLVAVVGAIYGLRIVLLIVITFLIYIDFPLST